MGRTKKKPEGQETAPKMEERTGQEQKERIFANPQTGDEAEVDLPSMEYLANGCLTLSDGEYMTKEEILKSGTLLQKLRLYISSIDLSGYFEAKEQLTDEEEKKIILSIQTKKDKDLSHLCVREYNTIFEFGTRLNFFFKRFQTSYAILAVLLNKWDSYEYTAKQLTILYNSMKASYITIWEADENQMPTKVEEIELYTESTRHNFINDLVYSNVLDGATLLFNKETENFYIDAGGKDGLYNKILKEAKSVIKDLSDFKAYAVVAEDYIKKSTLKFMPIPIYLSLKNAEEERYTRYLVKNKRYFRSELNQRIARGENILPEDEKKAVIPDFYEVKPSKNVLADCKVLIEKYNYGR